jgi:RES domain-containing protein
MDATQYIGTTFLKAKQLLFLKVPSIIVPEENNIVINPKHEAFKEIQVVTSQKFDVDKRLF